MKLCPFCAGEVPEGALKCKQCGKILDKKRYDAWYFKTSTLIIAFLCVGPFALPLLWWNPRFRLRNKIIASVIVLVAGYYAGILFARSVKSIYDYYQLLVQQL